MWVDLNRLWKESRLSLRHIWKTRAALCFLFVGDGKNSKIGFENRAIDFKTNMKIYEILKSICTLMYERENEITILKSILLKNKDIKTIKRKQDLESYKILDAANISVWLLASVFAILSLLLAATWLDRLRQATFCWTLSRSVEVTTSTNCFYKMTQQMCLEFQRASLLNLNDCHFCNRTNISCWFIGIDYYKTILNF